MSKACVLDYIPHKTLVDTTVSRANSGFMGCRLPHTYHKRFLSLQDAPQNWALGREQTGASTRVRRILQCTRRCCRSIPRGFFYFLRLATNNSWFVGLSPAEEGSTSTKNVVARGQLQQQIGGGCWRESIQGARFSPNHGRI